MNTLANFARLFGGSLKGAARMSALAKFARPCGVRLKGRGV
jgi:hypothetical protein